MGAVKDVKSGDWQWLKGDEVTVSFWNLPIGSGECARFDGTKGWLWSDTDCVMHLNYICQHREYLNFHYSFLDIVEHSFFLLVHCILFSLSL